MEDSKKTNKILYIIGGILLLALVWSHIFTDYPRSIYKKIRDQYKNEKAVTQKQLDSSEAAGLRAKEIFQEQLDAMQKMHEEELNSIYLELENETRKRRKNDAELKAYRDSDFNKRYGVFSDTYDFNPED